MNRPVSYWRALRDKIGYEWTRATRDPLDLLRRKQGVFVLLYHSVSDRPPADYPYSLSVRAFERQLRLLLEAFEVVDLGTLRRQTEPTGGEGLRFVLTFDDGFRDNRTRVLPLLEKYRVPATFFLSPRLITGPYRTFLSWHDVSKMGRSRWVGFGSHSYSHLNLLSLTPGDVRGELMRSRRILEEKTGLVINRFAYPYGNCNRPIRDLTGEYYETAFRADMNQNQFENHDPLATGRVMVTSSDEDPKTFLWKLATSRPIRRVKDVDSAAVSPE